MRLFILLIILAAVVFYKNPNVLSNIPFFSFSSGYAGKQYLSSISIPDDLRKEPIQKALALPFSIPYSDYRFNVFAEYHIEAKILSKKNYYMDAASGFSPVDLALGWGRVMSPSVVSRINVSQRGRFYFWRSEKLPISQSEINTHSVNAHIIPANSDVAAILSDMRVGDVIRLSGFLTDVNSTKTKRYWKSSRTRNDIGPGACEIIYVERAEIL